MSGPIVRTGTTPAFGDNWDRIFSGAAKTKAKAADKAKVVADKSGKATKTAAASAKSVVAKSAGAAKSVASKVKAKATGKK